MWARVQGLSKGVLVCAQVGLGCVAVKPILSLLSQIHWAVTWQETVQPRVAKNAHHKRKI